VCDSKSTFPETSSLKEYQIADSSQLHIDTIISRVAGALPYTPPSNDLLKERVYNGVTLKHKLENVYLEKLLMRWREEQQHKKDKEDAEVIRDCRHQDSQENNLSTCGGTRASTSETGSESKSRCAPFILAKGAGQTHQGQRSKTRPKAQTRETRPPCTATLTAQNIERTLNLSILICLERCYSDTRSREKCGP